MSKPSDSNATPSAGLVRGDWTAACRWNPATDSEVLAHVIRMARRQNELHRTTGAPNGVVLLDLDSTLYEVGPRTERILREFREHASSEAFPDMRAAIDRLETSHLGYSLHDTFEKLGFTADARAKMEDAFHAGRKFWAERFFTNEYLAFDEPYPGAPEFVRDLHATGVEIIYLTGRDEPGMGKGTRARLLQDGFPFDVERTQLILKREFDIDDLEHKSEATNFVKTVGTLIASFENEPPNVVAIHDIFPEAVHVFMDSVYSDRPADPRHGLYRIRSFIRG